MIEVSKEYIEIASAICSNIDKDNLHSIISKSLQQAFDKGFSEGFVANLPNINK